MAKLSSQYLRPNPFISYRDPQTGMWLVIQTTQVEQPSKSNNNKENLETDSNIDKE